MNYATSILLENWSSEGDIVERTIGRSIKETEEAFLAIGAPAQAGGFLSAASPESIAHLEKVLKTTEAILPALKKYSYEDLGPSGSEEINLL